MEVVLLRWMQDGDPGGLYRRALADFPDQDMVKRFMDKYYVEGGKSKDKAYKPIQMWQLNPTQELREACVLGNFAEVWLAKHEDDGSLVKTPSGEEGLVGINCLTKIQLPTIESLYGAMQANADYVIMGAGIPMEVPGILDALEKNSDTKLVIDVDGAEEVHYTHFSPKEFWTNAGKPELAEKKLKRPNFLPIVSSVMLAQAMLKRASGAGPTKGIQGFVIEMPTAGGHNAPPRGFKYDAEKKSHNLSLNERGEPVYGPKDEVDLVKFKAATKDLPFFLAGYYARPEKLQEVLALGGQGVQIGTSFAFANESGLAPGPKAEVLRQVASGDLSVFTDPVASPTGFPFKVLELEDSLSVKAKYQERPRVCNLGYLRTPYVDPNGKVGYRCAAEPVEDWVKKGGAVEATEGRKCLCNGLMANAGLPQVSPFKKKGESERYVEEILITAGDDINQCRKYMKDGRTDYNAKDVIDYLLGRFKEEYQAEADLYKDADKAEDPAVREKLVAKAKEIEGKIADVDQQLGASSK
jgi:nitronate monooxygenase